MAQRFEGQHARLLLAHVSLAAVYGQLGEKERAAALRELYALLPNFGTIAREEYGKWNDPEFVEHLLDGLRKAGLEIPPKEGAPGRPHEAPMLQSSAIPFLNLISSLRNSIKANS